MSERPLLLSGIDHTHDPAARSWVDGAADHGEFPIQNLPLGVFGVGVGQARIGCAIGDRVLDVGALADAAPPPLADALRQRTLNRLFALPGEQRVALRHWLFELLGDERHRTRLEPHLYVAEAVTMHLPAQIGDFTDFYVGIHHATNVGRLFRPDQPLLSNYKHVPIGYHGRSSSVRVSGASVARPRGQYRSADATAPEVGPTRRLDYELELGVWIAGENALGAPVPIADAAARVAGLCLLNDWSARDIQAWEYQPLGPFLAKNFLSSVSPWVVTAEALAPFRIAHPTRADGDPAPLPYLFDPADQSHGAFSLTLEAYLTTAAMRANGVAPQRLSRGSASAMYWTIAQMIAHHTVNGCNLRPGDLLGTGTISGSEAGSEGSLLELSRGGAAPVVLPGGEQRSFLQDGDELTLVGRAEAEGFRTIGFGACSGKVEAGI